MVNRRLLADCFEFQALVPRILLTGGAGVALAACGSLISAPFQAEVTADPNTAVFVLRTALD